MTPRPTRTGPHRADPRHDGVHRTDARDADARHTDPRHTDPRHTDPHAGPPHGVRLGRAAVPPAHPRAASRACPHPSAGRRPRHPRVACTTATPTPDLRAGLSVRFAHQLVEVLTGARPSGQLMRHTTLDGYGQLAALVRAGTLRRGGAADRPRLGPVHDRSPSPDVVEACVRVDLGSRHHMVAFRLELRGPAGQWQCTAVEAR
ncbi:Rv3235 family protein [Kitasatospora sp. NPDC127111]|uniref:Rv3235 family protein n=1 Tax=Kitasatospora sp. NPDC127111 TaxID=3345363 RepID=UPI00363BD499